VTRIILLTVLAFLLARALRTLVRGVIVGATGTSANRPPSARAVKLAKDPVCGTHVAPGSALSISSGGTTYYFCSPECRDKFRTRG
jgi:YHS domain-containing protein